MAFTPINLQFHEFFESFSEEIMDQLTPELDVDWMYDGSKFPQLNARLSRFYHAYPRH